MKSQRYAQTSITIAKAGEFIITDAEGRKFPISLLTTTVLYSPHPSKPRIRQYTLSCRSTPAPVDTIAWGRQFPERKDDMAWENDRSAYRAYASALQQSGERAFGYDIWTKSVPHRVLEKRFDLDINKKYLSMWITAKAWTYMRLDPTLGGELRHCLTLPEISYILIVTKAMRFSTTIRCGSQSVSVTHR